MAVGYHAITSGPLIAEVIRRITGKTLGRFFADEIAGPLGADFYIGTPPGYGRWAIKPEVGVPRPLGRWTVDGIAGVWLFTDNDLYFPGRARKTSESALFRPGPRQPSAPVAYVDRRGLHLVRRQADARR